MDRESVERLRFDRRLQHRREWIETGELDTHLEGLPDVSDKMTTPAELEAEEEAAQAQAPAPEAPAEPAPPIGGGDTFGGGGGFSGGGTTFGG